MLKGNRTAMVERTEEIGAMKGLERYEYPDCADTPFVLSWNGWEEAPHGGNSAEMMGAGDTGASAEFKQLIAEETRRSFEAGRARGLDEGRAAERAAHAAAFSATVEERIEQAVELVTGFEQQRARHFQALEQEAVKLALAVAARILRREAQTDPLLLMGAVRVALGQIASSTEVRLRVPPKDLELWTEAIALLPKLGTRPQVNAGEGMRLGECVIETSLGNADLGIPRQMAEMERGLLDETPRRGGSSDAAEAAAIEMLR